MHSVIIFAVILFVLSFVQAFITYKGEKKVSNKERASRKDLVDDPQILFEEEPKSNDKDDSDIEIIQLVFLSSFLF